MFSSKLLNRNKISNISTKGIKISSNTILLTYHEINCGALKLFAYKQILKVFNVVTKTLGFLFYELHYNFLYMQLIKFG